MSITDRLDEIQARLADPMVTYKENVTEDAPALVAALRAVLAYVDDCEGDYFLHADDIREAVTAALEQDAAS